MKNKSSLTFLALAIAISTSTISPLYAKSPKPVKIPTPNGSIDTPDSNRNSSQNWWCRSPVIEYRISADNMYRSREVLGERILGKGTTKASAQQDLKQKCDQFHRFDSSIKVGKKCGYATRCGTD